MTALTIILLSLLIMAGAGYNVYSDIQEIKNGPPDECELKKTIDYKAIEFYDCQLAILESIRDNAETVYRAALDQVEHDSKLNQYCMVIPQKMVLKHIRERDKAANNLYSARNKIYNMELKKIKAMNK